MLTVLAPAENICSVCDMVLEAQEEVPMKAHTPGNPTRENEVVFAYDDGTFEPDELVTVAAAREFLDNFAKVFGTNAVDAADLTTLTGADDEAMLNCGQVLAEFFGEAYELPQEMDSLEADAAA